MTAESKRTIIVQTGPATPPDLLLRDLQAIDGTKLSAQRLGTSFRGGGVATFVTIISDESNVDSIAEALCEHAKRLKTRGMDDLVFLFGGEILSSADEVNFRDVRCRRQLSLKEKSPEEVKELLLEGATY